MAAKAAAALFILLVFMGLLLRIHATAQSSSLMEYDDHFEYIEEIRAHYAAAAGICSFPALMRASQSKLRWHPPAYHALCALAGALHPRDVAVPVKIFTLLCNILTFWPLFLLLRHFFGNEYALILPGLSLLLFLPGHIVFSNLANNDVLLVPCCALFLLLCSRWQSDILSPRRLLALSLLCSLLLLTKYTGLIAFFSLNVLLLHSSFRARISFARYARLVLSAWAMPAVLAGWFYWTNFTIWGNPLHMPGFSPLREHSFTTFAFTELLSSNYNSWHESSSVLTGFFASLFSFDWVKESARETGLRNTVYCLALMPLLISGIGAVSSIKKEKYLPLNLFAFTALISIIRLFWRYELAHGGLKGAYVMFLAPACIIYFSEGCAKTRAWSRTAFNSCLAAVLFLDVAVIVYYCRFFITSPAAVLPL